MKMERLYWRTSLSSPAWPSSLVWPNLLVRCLQPSAPPRPTCSSTQLSPLQWVLEGSQLQPKLQFQLQSLLLLSLELRRQPLPQLSNSDLPLSFVVLQQKSSIRAAILGQPVQEVSLKLPVLRATHPLKSNLLSPSVLNIWTLVELRFQSIQPLLLRPGMALICQVPDKAS